MKTPFKIKLKKIGDNRLEYSVVKMDEKLKCNDIIFSASNGWVISSFYAPNMSVSLKMINLYGVGYNRDFRKNIVAFKTKDDMDTTISEIKQACREFSKHIRGVGNESKKSETN